MKHRPPGNILSGRDRSVNTRIERKRILIVCEGTETEPNYFNDLIHVHRLQGQVISGKEIHLNVLGTGRSALALVNYAAKQQREGAFQYDEIWCVFDKDDNADADFDNAIAKIREIKFLYAAWSNEAFELWYILHFEFLNTAPARQGKPRYFYTENWMLSC